MKVADMYRGMEVAVRWFGYEDEKNYRHAKILHVQEGGGHAQQHKVIEVDEDGKELPGVVAHMVPARRVIMSWRDYMAKMGDWLSEQEEQEFKQKLKMSETVRHLELAQEIGGLLALAGIAADPQSTPYRYDPTQDDSYGASIIVHSLDKFREMIEGPIRERLMKTFTSPAPSEEFCEEDEEATEEHSDL